MSFQNFYSQPTQKEKLSENIRKKDALRKEEDSAMTQSISSFPKDEERTSLFTSSSGSISVEAALVTPIFFLAVCCLCYLLEIMSIQSYVRGALHDTAREIAKEVYMMPAVSPSKVEEKMVSYIGSERLNRSIVKGGSTGLDASGTVIMPGNGIIQMHVEYEILLPISMFGKLTMACEDGFRIKGWNGYSQNGMFTPREDIVYITETGVVYHKDYHCTYLELSIQMVTKDSVSSMRNEYGEKYHACGICGGNGKKVYITGQGNRYHSSLGCSGLKRKVYAVPVSEALGKGACSRCGS